MSAFLLTVCSSLHLFLWLQDTIWNHFLNSKQLWSHPPLLYYYWKYTAFLYVKGPTQLYTYCFIQLSFISVRSRKEKKYAFILSFIVPFTGVLWFFHMDWITVWDHLLLVLAKVLAKELPLIFFARWII